MDGSTPGISDTKRKASGILLIASRYVFGLLYEYPLIFSKELIKVRGWQVSPSEIEACLLMHPSINDACVVGVDFKDQRGELPRAYVVLEPGEENSLTEKDVQDHIRKHLAKYKALNGGVQFRLSIPRSPAGKPYRRIFRTEAREEILAENEKLAGAASSIVNRDLDKNAIAIHTAELTDEGDLQSALESLNIGDSSARTEADGTDTNNRVDQV
jgi:hypothetical protein